MTDNGNQIHLQLTKGYKVFDFQIAGHKFREMGIGFLQDNANGTVLKPMQKAPKGEIEAAFYRDIFRQDLTESISDIWRKRFRSFMCSFYGLTYVPIKGKDEQFLVLENLTSGFIQPNTIDIKIGATTWDINSTKAKVAYEISKQSKYAMDLGFRILGMKIYDESLDRYQSFGKVWSHTLEKDDVQKTLLQFFGPLSDAFDTVINNICEQLENLLELFSQQDLYHFLSSSLLITYEAKTEKISKNQGPIRVDVKMIDFTHTYACEYLSCHDPDFEKSPDHNYIEGIKGLLKELRKITQA